ncbi:MAG: MoxR family ATPase [Gammaproteobacteria bacterium]|nr:MoxR family ATPase [Gammaproteobacteria bacterium]
MSKKIPDWCIYKGTPDTNPNGKLSPHLSKLKPPPPWRRFDSIGRRERGAAFQPEAREILRVNAALILRRPLLVTGNPGTGKTSFAYAIARELGLEPVLRWSITSRTALQDGLYRYDAIGRLQDTPQYGQAQGKLPDISRYLKLGPLGTAFVARKEKNRYLPRILLIDEIDKSDIDLPNDLLHLFEEGEFEIPELSRLKQAESEIEPHDFAEAGQTVRIPHGRVRCQAFPLVMMTSNGEREFPPAFLRRCLQLNMELPDRDKLARIVTLHFGERQADDPMQKQIEKLIEAFEIKRDGKTDGKKHDLATDQLLNAIHLVLENINPQHPLDAEMLLDTLWKPLSDIENG